MNAQREDVEGMWDGMDGSQEGAASDDLPHVGGVVGVSDWFCSGFFGKKVNLTRRR
jgi:hypothetical protein